MGNEKKEGETLSLVLSPLTTPSSSRRQSASNCATPMQSLQLGAARASENATGTVLAPQNSDSCQPSGHASKTPHVMVSECYDCRTDEPEGNGGQRLRQLCNSMRGFLRLSVSR